MLRLAECAEESLEPKEVSLWQGRRQGPMLRVLHMGTQLFVWVICVCSYTHVCACFLFIFFLDGLSLYIPG